MTRGPRLLLLAPYVLLLLVFFTTPLALMLMISVSRQSFGQMEWTVTLHHYVRFFSDRYYLGVLGDTLWLGLVVMDCIGFRRKTRDEIAHLTGAPTLVANLLVARVAAELLGR